ncbi:MAG: hypothetical protein ABIO72_02420 [Patescibacteria group bacterium]
MDSDGYDILFTLSPGDKGGLLFSRLKRGPHGWELDQGGEADLSEKSWTWQRVLGAPLRVSHCAEPLRALSFLVLLARYGEDRAPLLTDDLKGQLGWPDQTGAVADRIKTWVFEERARTFHNQYLTITKGSRAGCASVHANKGVGFQLVDPERDGARSGLEQACDWMRRYARDIIGSDEYKAPRPPAKCPAPAPDPTDASSELSYFKYRDENCPRASDVALAHELALHYRVDPVELFGRAYPVTVTWRNDRELVPPDSILGALDDAPARPLVSSANLVEDAYARAREFIRGKYETIENPFDGIDYVLRDLRVHPDGTLSIDGALGFYYDNILTQYAMEWELRKALLEPEARSLDAILDAEMLPLRASVEALGDPLRSGAGRCAALTVSTLVVVRRPKGFFCFFWRRSQRVGVSKGMLHVAPAGMFERRDNTTTWSVEMNVWRELLEEVYNVKEMSQAPSPDDAVLAISPIGYLVELLQRQDGTAEHSVTGTCCDLLNLRTEICTVLFLNTEGWSLERMVPNWEYEPHWFLTLALSDVERTIREQHEATGKGVVPSAAACFQLGLRWLRERHGVR